jgi:L-ascorbate metabolism protein UlaG (beta-lactamase superfamily)
VTITIKWLHHSAFEIKAGGKTIYTDLEKHGEPSGKADVVLISHSHSDHCDPSMISQVRRTDTVVIAPSDCAQQIGGSVKSLKPGDETSIGDIKIKAVEAYNVKRFRSPGNPFHPKGFGVGYLIMAEGKVIYFAGDTDLISEMKQLGSVDVALLPSGDKYTMDNQEAAEAAIAIKPKIAVPMHRWSTNPKKFGQRVEAKSRIKALLLRKGQEFSVP